MAVSRDTYPNSATNPVLMERMGQIAVYVVENVVAWDNVIILMELARMVARSGTLVQDARRLALMDIMDKNATEYAMLHALVVTTLTDCVILAVIQDGRGTSVNNPVTVIFMEKIVACLVDIVWTQSNVITSMEHV